MTDQPEDSPAPGADEWDAAVADVSRAMSGAPAPTPSEQPAPVADVEAPEQDEDQPEAAASVTPAAEEPPQDDPWASVPEAIRQEYEALRQERDSLQHKWKSDSERARAYQRQLHALRAEKPAPAAPAEGADASQNPFDGIDGAIAKLKGDFPELGDALAPLVEAMKSVKSDVDPLKAASQAAIADAAQAFQTEQEQALAARHPDWQAVADDAFGAWIVTQPAWMQAIVQSNAAAIVDADGAATVLDRYKQAKGIAAQPAPAADPAPDPTDKTRDRRARQLAGSASPAPRGSQAAASGLPPESDPAAMFEWAVGKVAKQMGR